MSKQTKQNTYALIKDVTLKGGPLKLVDKFHSIRNSVSSTKNDNIRQLEKAWKAMISYWSYASQTWPIKNGVFSKQLYGCTKSTLTKRMEKKAWRQLHINTASHNEQVLDTTSQKTTAVRSWTTYLQIYPSLMAQICGTLLQEYERTHKRLTPIDPFTWTNKGRTNS